ncbi:hypothetical protein, partial [Enterococcus faecium]|uniref:hypothetical protein n=1 Tax=Enterococcus faecium TaxID=1352 RepID=UPI0034E96B4F
MRYQLAETISSGYNYEVDLFGSESIDFHKQRFYEFYTNYLSYISDSINIKTESEMNENDVRWIKLIENTTD